MKTKVIFLLVLLLIGTVARADFISIDFYANPSVLPDPPWVGAFFYTSIQNLTDQPIYFSEIYQTFGTPPPVTPTSAGEFVCLLQPDYRYLHPCNSANELELGPAGNAFFKMGGIFGAGNPPGTYTWTVYVFGGTAGANDFGLLGSDTATVTVVPEPSTLVLFGTGLAGMVVALRRKLLSVG